MLDFRVHNLPPQLRVHSSQTIRSTIAEAKMSYKCAGDRGIGKDHRIPLAELLSPKRRNPSLEVTKAMSAVSTDRGAGGSQIAQRQTQYALIGGTGITHNLCAGGSPRSLGDHVFSISCMRAFARIKG